MRVRVARIHGQQLFVEAADFAGAIDEVDFQDPVARVTGLIRLAQWNRIAVTNSEMIRVRRPAFMREKTDQMPCGEVAEFPSPVLTPPLSMRGSVPRIDWMSGSAAPLKPMARSRSRTGATSPRTICFGPH